MNRNPIMRSLAQLQGVVIGSAAYRAAGLEPYASQTGGQSAYGWNHSGLVWDEGFVRAAVANMLSRPLYYDDEDFRESAYNLACRPDGWEASDAGDVGSGWLKGRARYQTPNGSVTVSSPDPQHFWMNPAWDILDVKSHVPINLLVGTAPANAVVHVCVRYWLLALAGMIQNHGPYLAGGRATARILDTVNQARKRNLLADDEGKALGKVFADWIEKYALPQLETAPGVRETKGEGVCRWVQECGWMLLPLWEAESVWAKYKDFGPRFRAIRERIGGWMLDIDEIAGGAARWYNLRITPKMVLGLGGRPLLSLKGAITASDVTGPDDYTVWSLAAADVARTDHPGPQADAFYERVKAKALKNATAADKVWLVDRNRKAVL